MGGLEAKVQTSTAFMDLGQIVAAEERKKKKQIKARKGKKQKSPKKKKKTKTEIRVATTFPSTTGGGGFPSRTPNTHEGNERLEGGVANTSV